MTRTPIDTPPIGGRPIGGRGSAGPRRVLLGVLGAALVAALGCQPGQDSTGAPGHTARQGAGGPGCDPHGWGPLSGCDTAQDSAGPGSADAAGDTALLPAGCPDYDYASFDYDTGRVIEVVGATGEVSAACRAALEADGEAIAEAFARGPAPTGWVVTQTVRTGSRECVIGLHHTGSGEDLHSRRVSTPADCQAHPPGSTYHTGGGR